MDRRRVVTGLTAADVAPRVASVRERIIRAGGDDTVRIVAVTKGFGADAPRAAIAAGLTTCGESYSQELEVKGADLRDVEIQWHFIGGVQRNKVRRIAEFVDLWQSVDRPELGAEIAKRRPGARVLVQVNVTGAPGQGGVPPVEVEGLVQRLVELGLEVEGLMAIGPMGQDLEIASAFRSVRRIRDELGLAELSIGMSNDLEIAVGEGSTMVRVGRDLFGVRPSPRRSWDT